MDMRDIQQVSLDILKYVAHICEEQNFRYCLMYGTLIGAVRHKGYIPWDDDVDIMMPRPDYERFLSWAAVHKSEMGYYEIFNRNTHRDYFYGITRVSDSRYEIIQDGWKNYGMGIFIDIYPYDALGNDKEEALSKLKETRRLCDIIVAMTQPDQSVPNQLNIKGKIVYKMMQMKRRILGIDYYWRKLESQLIGKTYDDSYYVGPLMWFFTKPEKVLFERSIFDQFVKAPFEDGVFNIPAKYHELLSLEYGNYMQLPPIEKRIHQHHYKAYKKE